MKKIYSIMAVAALMGLTACNSDDTTNTGALPDGAVAFTANVENTLGTASAKAMTRAAGETAYTGPLKLWYKAINGSAGADYTVNNGSCTSTLPLYWDNLAAVLGTYQFYATSNITTLNAGATGGTVAADQSVEGCYAKADLMIDGVSTTKRKQTLEFNLKHLMAQFTVTLTTSGSDKFTAEQLRAATVVAKALQPAYTLALTPTIAVSPATTGATSDITLCADADNATATDAFKFRAIVPAQTATSVVVTIAGNEYTMALGADYNLTAGANTIQPLIAKKTGVTIGTVNVTDWVESSMTGKDIAIDGVTVPTTALSDITEAGSLFINTDSKTGTYPVAYGGTPAKASIDYTTATPLLWDNLAVGTSYIYNAIFVPTAETGASNQEKDYLTCTTAATPWGTTPTFALTHAMAKLTIKLQCTDGTYTADQLKGATVNISIAKSAAVSTAASSFGITNDAIDKTVTMTNAGATADAFGTYTAIVYPQTTGDITFKINGNDFTMNGIALTTPGQNHAITINVKKTGIEFGNVTVTDWGTTNLGDGDIDINK